MTQGVHQPRSGIGMHTNVFLALRRFDIDDHHVIINPRNQSRFDKRGFAAAAGAVDHTDWDSIFFSDRFANSIGPETDTGGYVVSIARTGQQLQEKVGVLGTIRA